MPLGLFAHQPERLAKRVKREGAAVATGVAQRRTAMRALMGKKATEGMICINVTRKIEPWTTSSPFNDTEWALQGTSQANNRL